MIRRANQRGRFLDMLEPTALAALHELAITRHWHAGAQLAREGDRPTRVLILRVGRVKIVVNTVDGTEVVLAIRGPGDIIGEVSAVDGGPHSATAVGIEDVTCLAVEAEQFSGFLAEHPSAGVAISSVLAARLREADAKRAEYGVLDSVGRVARLLVQLAEDHGRPSSDGVEVTVRLSQEELAGFTGSSREAVSRALRMLRDDGLVTTRRRGVTVHDLERLRERGT